MIKIWSLIWVVSIVLVIKIIWACINVDILIDCFKYVYLKLIIYPRVNQATMI
jgi:hypothetical protein